MNEEKSKTQKKREAQAFNALGEALVALNAEKLSQLPLSDGLKNAIFEAKSLKSFLAIRRQALWIGKLIRKEGGQDILEAYEQLQLENAAQNMAFHTVELWRERLIHEDKEALTAFIEAYPAVDIQKLRNMIKKAQKEEREKKSLGAKLALFRYIRQFIQ